MGFDGTSGFDAVVLAGGKARRFGSDKSLAEVDGRTLLQRAVDAVAGARRIVVVGEERADIEGITWTQESPPGGGPAAGLAAGLAVLGMEAEPLVAVVASDLPLIDADAVARLFDAAAGKDGAASEDPEGRVNPLLGVYRTRRLKEALSASPSLAGVALTRALSALDLASVQLDAAVDADTPEELERIERGPSAT